MMIHDLEFFNSYNQEQQDDAAIVGGSSFESYTDVYASPNNVYAASEAKATGDYTSAVSSTAVTLSNQPGYSGGYAAGYSGGYGLDTYGTVSKGVTQGVALV
jgi:hypothetical protein